MRNAFWAALSCAVAFLACGRSGGTTGTTGTTGSGAGTTGTTGSGAGTTGTTGSGATTGSGGAGGATTTTGGGMGGTTTASGGAGGMTTGAACHPACSAGPCDACVQPATPLCLAPLGVAPAHCKKAYAGCNTAIAPACGPVGTFAVGMAPAAIAFDGTNMWVANQGSNDVTELSPSGAT